MSGNTARQHGAMEHSVPPCDLDAVRLYRLGRVRAALAERDLAGVILYDPVNVRYAVDATNMQVWCAHNEARYLYVPTEGPVRLFEFSSGDLLTAGLPTVDEVRPAVFFLYFIAGQRHEDRAKAWADELDSVIREHSSGNRRIAIDRVAPQGVIEMQRRGYEIVDGFEVMENARKIKSAGEILLMRHAVAVCERAIAQMREALKPGITENALWAELHRGNIAGGGEWIETRPARVRAAHQPVVPRIVDAGDRARRHRGLRHRPGRPLRLLLRHLAHLGVRRAAERRAAAHLCRGLCAGAGEQGAAQAGRELSRADRADAPACRRVRRGPAPTAWGCTGWGSATSTRSSPTRRTSSPATTACSGRGMVICVEGLATPAGGRESVKLEEQVLITATGHEQLSTYPLEESWL